MIKFIQKVVRKISHLGRSRENVLKEKTASPLLQPELTRPATEEGSRPRRRPRKRSQKSAVVTAGIPAPVVPWRVSQFKVPPAEGKIRFHDFDLPDPLMQAIMDLGFLYCTPIQAEILPAILSGKDAVGRAQTGTGKTAAFLIAVITRMLNNPIQGGRKPGTPRALVIAPTRELVLQISEEARQLSKYTGLKVISLFGGMDFEKQKLQLADIPVDIVVATPGRLLDFQQRRALILNRIEGMIIDEADRMLDMGFIPDVRKIIHSTPPREKRQTLLFSATLTKEIIQLAAQWTRNPVDVDIEPTQVAVDTVDQIVYIVTTDDKFALLYNIIEKQNLRRVLVFCNRKDEVRRLAEMLTRYRITCAELSGDIPQNQRIQRLDQFKTGKLRVLVATDVASRGLHIEGMDHVINFMLPHDPEDYVHRIGRTGRAGATGTSISFADEKEAFYLPPIEAFMGRDLRCIQPPEDWLTLPRPAASRKPHRPESGRKTTVTTSAADPNTRSRSRKRQSRPPVNRSEIHGN